MPSILAGKKEQRAASKTITVRGAFLIALDVSTALTPCVPHRLFLHSIIRRPSASLL
jgi:hypothetical protein